MGGDLSVCLYLLLFLQKKKKKKLKKEDYYFLFRKHASYLRLKNQSRASRSLKVKNLKKKEKKTFIYKGIRLSSQ